MSCTAPRASAGAMQRVFPQGHPATSLKRPGVVSPTRDVRSLVIQRGVLRHRAEKRRDSPRPRLEARQALAPLAQSAAMNWFLRGDERQRRLRAFLRKYRLLVLALVGLA